MSSVIHRRIRRPLKAPERPLAIRKEYITDTKTLLIIRPRTSQGLAAGAYKVQDEDGLNQFIVTGPRDDESCSSGPVAAAASSSRSRRDRTFREVEDASGLPLFTLPRRIVFQENWEMKLPGSSWSTTVAWGGPRWTMGAAFRDWSVEFENAAAFDAKELEDRMVTLHVESHGNILACFDIVDGDRKVAEVRESIAHNKKLALMASSRRKSDYHPVLDVMVVPGVDLSLVASIAVLVSDWVFGSKYGQLRSALGGL